MINTYAHAKTNYNDVIICAIASSNSCSRSQNLVIGIMRFISLIDIDIDSREKSIHVRCLELFFF